MKWLIGLMLLIQYPCSQVFAQNLYVGGDSESSLFLSGGQGLYFEELHLKPSDDFQLKNINLKQLDRTGEPNSIRFYSFENTTLEFSGSIDVSFLQSEVTDIPLNHLRTKVFQNQNSKNVFSEVSEGKVSIPFSGEKITAIELYALPSSAFAVSVTSATCPDSSNGSITISSSNTDYSYRYAIDDQAPVALTDNTQTISNLSAGIYTVCVTVDGVADYNVCYTIEITEPAPLVASSRIDMSSRNMQFDLSGSEEYQVTLNGKTFLTKDTNLSLNLVPGMNRVEVATALDCQGVYFEEIFVSEEVKVYPNPTPGPLQLFVAGSDREVEMSITSLSGNVIRKEILTVPGNRIVETTMGRLPEGLYLITLKGNTVKTTHKIIKE